MWILSTPQVSVIVTSVQLTQQPMDEPLDRRLNGLGCCCHDKGPGAGSTKLASLVAATFTRGWRRSSLFAPLLSTAPYLLSLHASLGDSLTSRFHCLFGS